MTGVVTDPAATARRVEQLTEYMDGHVLDRRKVFRCTSSETCRRSAEAKEGVKLFEGQLSHVGAHYDTNVEGRDFRVLIVPMEAGSERARVTLDERRDEQVRPRINQGFRKRNPHMRGVTLALRLAFGTGLGEDRAGEWLAANGSTIHLFDLFAMANLVLCSAIAPRVGDHSSGTGSRTTPVMQSNCVRHLLSTIGILEPTLVISQGSRKTGPSVESELRRHLAIREEHAPLVWTVSLGDLDFVWVPLYHPTYKWDWLSRPYLDEVVAPAITAGREAALSRGNRNGR